jgi:hypothetical protein
LRLGLAYFTPEKPELGVPRHLWFVLSDPSASSRIVIANLSTTPCTSGEVCLVKPGEHAKISRDSYLRFRDARVTSTTMIEPLFQSGVLQETQEASTILVQKLQRALVGSRSVILEARTILTAQGVASEGGAAPAVAFVPENTVRKIDFEE